MKTIKLDMKGWEVKLPFTPWTIPLSFVVFIFLLVIFLLQQLPSYCDHHPMIDSQEAF
jgi:hypothetical protein